MKIEVCFALPDKQWLVTICLPDGSSVIKGIMASGLLDLLPDLELTNKVGIFGKKVSLNHKLKEGDRIEIYRPLILTPNQLRLLRAKKRRFE